MCEYYVVNEGLLADNLHRFRLKSEVLVLD